jgi:hypothetical protein
VVRQPGQQRLSSGAVRSRALLAGRS